MVILLSGEEIGVRDALASQSTTRRGQAAKAPSPLRGRPEKRFGGPVPALRGVHARLRTPETAKTLLRAIPTLAIHAFTT
jgi:hypothetical protein